MRVMAVLCALLFGVVQASAPIAAKLTACVLDGVVITTDGAPITLTGPHHIDLAAYAGKKIRLAGSLSPGDLFSPSADPDVLGACSAAEKFDILPALARVEVEQESLADVAREFGLGRRYLRFRPRLMPSRGFVGLHALGHALGGHILDARPSR